MRTRYQSQGREQCFIVLFWFHLTKSELFGQLSSEVNHKESFWATPVHLNSLLKSYNSIIHLCSCSTCSTKRNQNNWFPARSLIVRTVSQREIKAVCIFLASVTADTTLRNYRPPIWNKWNSPVHPIVKHTATWTLTSFFHTEAHSLLSLFLCRSPSGSLILRVPGGSLHSLMFFDTPHLTFHFHSTSLLDLAGLTSKLYPMYLTLISAQRKVRKRHSWLRATIQYNAKIRSPIWWCCLKNYWGQCISWHAAAPTEYNAPVDVCWVVWHEVSPSYALTNLEDIFTDCTIPFIQSKVFLKNHPHCQKTQKI